MTDQRSGETPDKDAVPDAPSSFFAELKKRRVYRVAIGYAVVAWGGTEILDGVISRLGWPDWLAGDACGNRIRRWFPGGDVPCMGVRLDA